MHLSKNKLILGWAVLSVGISISLPLWADGSACGAVVLQDAPGVMTKGESISHRYGYSGGPGNSTAQAKQDAANEAARKCYADPGRAAQDAEAGENKLACELASIDGCNCHFDAVVSAQACRLIFTNYENDGNGGIRKCVVTVDPVTRRELPCKSMPITSADPVPGDVLKKLSDRRVQGTWQASAEGFYDVTGYSCSANGVCEEGSEPGKSNPGQW